MDLHLIADLQENYERFVRRVSESKIIWGLQSLTDGWAYCPSNELECDVLLFWSDRAYAKRLAVEEWDHYQPVAIELDGFINRWLPGMQKDGVLAGINFNGNLAGLEVTPGELLHALTKSDNA